MDDFANKETERILAELERKIKALYADASRDMKKKAEVYFARFAERDKQQKAALDAGRITEEQYRQWRLAQIGRGERFEKLRDELADRMTNANQTAAAYINDQTPGIYSLNHNYEAYTIEKVAGNVGFTIYDEQTVRRLIQEDPNLLPKRRVNAPKDKKWNRKQFAAEITSGILQGESIGKLANRVQNLSDANRAGAIRNARTAVTGAQNGGRQASYDRAKEMGLKLRKRWIATKDMRTRHAHAMLDGQTVELDKPFEIEGHKLMFPGDPTGLARLVWNCRCTMRTVEKEGIEAEPRQMRVRNPETGQNEVISEMAYSEWAGWKNVQQTADNGFKKAQVQKAMIEKPLYDIMGVSEKDINISALPTETKKLVEDSVRRSVEKFPQLKGHFTRIDYDESIEAIASSKSITGSVKLSKKFKDYQKLQKDYDYDVRLGWHPKGTTAQSTITHEIGHQLDGLLTKKGIYGGSVSQYGVTRTSVAVQKEVLSRIGLSDERLREIRKQYSDMGYKGKDLNHAVQFERKEFIEKHICSYAAENSNEFFACLYAEYMDSPEPREAAIVFGEILERIMGEIK